MITRLLTKFCNHGLATFYGSSSSRLHSVSRARSRPLLASVGELVTIMLLAGSTGGPWRGLASEVMGRTKFTTSGAHDVIATTSPQKNDVCTEELRDRA